MIHLQDTQIFLTSEDWNRLNGLLSEKIDLIAFDAPRSTYSMLEIINGLMELEHWKNEFNFKLISLGTNYAYMYSYYEKLGSTDIYKERSNNDLGLHIWFAYEAESLFSRLFSLIDNIYHILNVRYDLKIKQEFGFRKNLISELRKKNKLLSVFLSNIRRDSRYKAAEALRNDFTHNHSPLNITTGIKRSNNKTIIGKGDYTKIEDVVKSVDEFLDLLREIVEEVKKHL